MDSMLVLDKPVKIKIGNSRPLHDDLSLVRISALFSTEQIKIRTDTHTIAKAITRRTDNSSPNRATANVNCNVGAMYCINPTTESGRRFVDALKKRRGLGLQVEQDLEARLGHLGGCRR